MPPLRTPTVDKCFDCIVADPYVCPHTCINTAESEAGTGWVIGSVDSSTGLGTPDENFRDALCALRRADPDPDDPALAGPDVWRLKNQAAIESNGAIFADSGTGDYWLFDGDLLFEYGPDGPTGGDGSG